MKSRRRVAWYAKSQCEPTAQRGRVLRRACTFVIAYLFLSHMLSVPAEAQVVGHEPQTNPQYVESLVKRINPATVHIEVKRTAISSADDDSEEVGHLISDEVLGSGTIVDPHGLIVTNAHVVRGARSVFVTLFGEERPYKAMILGRDEETDIALLKINAVTPAHFDLNATSSARYGEFVLTFGTPFGFGHSVSYGIVSAPQRETEYSVYRYIQTDAAINPGNSGGPLVDLEGNLLGINSLIYSLSGGSEGVGFALPLATVRRVVESIRQFGYVRRARFGLTLTRVSESLSEGLHIPQSGLLIEDVDSDGPAARADIRSGDVLLKIDRQPINSFEDLDVTVSSLPEGKVAQLLIRREGLETTVSAAPDFSPRPPSSLEDIIDPASDTIDRLGVVAVDYGERLRNLIPDAATSDGIVIAAKCGARNHDLSKLEPGDIIHAVNGQMVHGMNDLRRRLSAIPDDEPLVLQLERNGHLRFIVVAEIDSR